MNSQDNIHLHGSENGFYGKVWGVEELITKPYPSVTLSCESPDMEEGYPGNIKIKATLSLKFDKTLEVSYRGYSDKDTLLNITNHVYFNLGYDSIQNDFLKISSNKVLECDNQLISTGNLMSIKNSAYDFRDKTSLPLLSKINGLYNTFLLQRLNF